jgi:hypothetical protein
MNTWSERRTKMSWHRAIWVAAGLSVAARVVAPSDGGITEAGRGVIPAMDGSVRHWLLDETRIRRARCAEVSRKFSMGCGLSPTGKRDLMRKKRSRP